MVTKICEICGKEFTVVNSRKDTARYCCKKCADSAKVGKKNTICTYCGKEFHLKPYKLTTTGLIQGHYCSRKCMALDRKTKMSGELNHQFGLIGRLNASFKGLEISQKNNTLTEILVYMPSHPYRDKNNRVKKHRLIVEQNYHLFDFKYFEVIDNQIVLKPSSNVHHLDGNHNNNSIDNLVPCTRIEHKQFHKSKITERDKLGRIVKVVTAVVKREELLGSPEEDNQQPSISLTTDEGSETNS